MAVIQISDRKCEQYKAEAKVHEHHYKYYDTKKRINKWELNA